jgi:hypothetical protein
MRKIEELLNTTTLSSEIQRRALVIVDNQLALNAGWDEEMLRREFTSLQAVDPAHSTIGLR